MLTSNESGRSGGFQVNTQSRQEGGRWALGRKALALAAAVTVAGMTQSAWARKGGGGKSIKVDRVVRGKATFQDNGNRFVIRAGDRAIINYKQFDVPKGMRVKFIQPSAQAKVLNRIDSASPSKINGNLASNGIVYFVNPAGVIFGPDSVINVGQIYAAAGTISDANFVAGIDRFENVRGSVINRGHIEGSAVFLVGRLVDNAGTIIGAEGAVTMASGDDVLIGREDGRIFVKVDAATAEAAASRPGGVGNGEAGGGSHVGLGAGDLYSVAVRASGKVKGKDVVVDAGPKGTAVVAGKLDATGEQGGRVEVLGKRVAVTGRIDASGTSGGGTVLVGGDVLGQGATRTSDVTYVGANSEIRADATGAGDGGKVVVFAKDTARVYGQISARGGAEGGNGGFVETSGKGFIDINVTPDVSAPKGQGGQWLIDPNNIEIVAGGGNTNINNTDPFLSSDDTAQLGVDLIRTALTAGASVTITTGTGGANAQEGNITLSVPLDFDGVGSKSLTLTAHNNIVLNAGVSDSNLVTVDSLNLTLNANSDAAGGGGVIVAAPVALSGGAFVANGDSISLGANISSGAQSFNAPVLLSAPVTLDAGAGNVTFGSTINGAQALTVNSTGATVFGGVVGGTTPLTTLSTNAGGSASLPAAVTTTADQVFNDAVALTANTAVNAGPGNVTFASTVDGAFALDVNSTGVSTFGGAVGGTTPLAALTTDAGGTAAINGGALSATGAVTHNDAVTLGAAVTTVSAGNVSYASTVDGASALTVSSPGATTFGAAVGGTTPLLSLATDAPGTASLRSVTTVNGQSLGDGTVTLNGAYTTTNSPFAVPQAAVLAGNTSVSTGTGNASFGGTVNGAFDLAVNSTGATNFAQAVGGTAALASLTTDGGGTTTLGAGTVTTAGNQTYNDALTLTANTVVNTGSGDANFFSSVNGAFTLDVNSGGTTRFGSAVGGTTPLVALTTDAAGTTAINGGAVTTNGAQTYNDSVTLGSAATLITAGAATFNGTVDGASALTVNSPGATTFNAAVGGTTALLSLTTDAPGTASLRSVTTSGAQAYNDTAVTLNGTYTTTNSPFSVPNAATLAGNTVVNTGTGAITFGSTINGAFALAANSTGATTFSGVIGGTTALAGVSTNAGGATALNGGAVTTTGEQNYGDAVTLSVNPTVINAGAGNVTFGSTVDGAVALTVNSTGATTFAGAVGGATPLASVATNAGGTASLQDVTTVGAQTYLDNTVTLDGAYATTNATFSVGNAALLGGDAVISTGNADVIFSGTVNGAQSLTVNTTGNTLFGGAVGGSTPLTAVLTNAGGTTQINGGGVATTAAQTYNDNVVLGANAVVASTAGPVTFNGTVNGPFSLEVNAGGVTAFNQIVGGGTALSSLTTNGGGVTQINGTAVTTTGAQRYDDNVTLGANTVIAAGSAAFNGTVNGAFTLAVNSAGATTFAEAVGGTTPLVSLTTDALGTASLRDVTTMGAQTYNDTTVTLNGTYNTTDSAFTVPNAAVLAGNTTVNTGNGLITFGSTINGPGGLAANTNSTLTLTGIIGGTTPLAFLTTDAGGATALNSGTVNTTGDVLFGDPVTLGVNTVITSSAGNVTFASTLNGAVTLAVNAPGTTTFGGAVGGATPLATLTTDGPGATAINGGAITTTGTQTYGDAVTIGVLDATLSAGAANIVFNGTLNGPRGLTVNTTGATRFNGAVGGVVELASLTTSALGTTEINGGRVSTAGAQTYNDAVTVGANALITSSGTGNVTFATTLDGGFGVNVQTAGTSTFGGVVGGATPLASLTTDGPGTTAINGGAVTSTGGQAYNDAVTLGLNTLITAGGDATFASTVNGAVSLEVRSPGLTSFNGVVGGMTRLTTLTTDDGIGADSTAINAGQILTTGNQTYNDAVTVGVNSTLDAIAADVRFNSTVNGPAALVVDTSGTTRFAGAVGASTPLASLTTNLGGPTLIDGGRVSTAGTQTYNDPVTIGANTLIDSAGAGPLGDVTFASTLNGGFDLRVTTAGTTMFGGAVGGVTPLANLRTDGGGITAINGGAITTSAAQLYDDAVVIGAPGATLTAGTTITFNAPVSGAALTASAVTTTFNADADLAALTVNGATVINVPSIRTVDRQAYNGPVLVNVDAALTGGEIDFNGPGNVTPGTAGIDLLLQPNGVTDAINVGFAADTLGALDLTDGDLSRIANGFTTITVGRDLGQHPIRVQSATFHDPVLIRSTAGGFVEITTHAAGVPGYMGDDDDATLTVVTPDIRLGADVFTGDGVNFADQLYDGPVTLVGPVTLTGKNATFNFTVDSDSDATPRPLTVNTNNAGLTWFKDDVGVGSRLASLTTNADGTTLLGDPAVARTLFEVRTTGDQNYGDSVALPFDTRLTGNDITFDSTVDATAAGARALEVLSEGNGLTWFKDDVGSNFRLTSLTTNADGATRLGLTPPGTPVTVLTSGDQTYGDAVQLQANATLTGNDITFRGTVDSFDATARSLDVVSEGGGVTAFEQSVGATNRLLTLTTNLDGQTVLGAAGGPGLIDIMTTGDQTYGEAVRLADDVRITGNDITFSGTVDSFDATPHSLDVRSEGNGLTLFTDNVGATNRLSNLTTNADGRTALGSGGTFVALTTQDQTYGDPVELRANATLTGNDITFEGTVDSDATARTLLVNSDGSGVTWFQKDVGAGSRLADLTTNVDGSTHFGRFADADPAAAVIDVLTSGDQTYNDAAVLEKDLKVTGNGLTFGGTVDSLNATARSLEAVSEGGGLTWFKRDVGGTNRLSNLTTNADGVTRIGDPADGFADIVVRTTADQNYFDPAVLGDHATLTGNDITFHQTLDSLTAAGRSLEIISEGGGVTAFRGNVGATNRLLSLETNADGTTVLGSGGTIVVLTSADQTYGDAVRLAADATLTGNDITFEDTVNSFDATARSLDVISEGNGVTWFQADVGTSFRLSSLTTNEDGSTHLGEFTNIDPTIDVLTSGDQFFGDPVILETNAILTGNDITFNSTVDSLNSTARSLEVTSEGSGLTWFKKDVGAANRLLSVTTNDDGITRFGDPADAAAQIRILTTADQNYNDPVRVADNAVLTGNDITFHQTVDSLDASARSLEVITEGSGVTWFKGDVGVSNRLENLTTNDDGETRLGDAVSPAALVQVLTTLDQSYGDALRLIDDAKLTGRNMTFHKTVDSFDAAAKSLEAVSEGSGLTWFKDDVGVGFRLRDLTTNEDGTTRLGDVAPVVEVRTVGDQSYGDAIELADDAELTGNDITFHRTVDSLTGLNQSLEVFSEGNGLTWFKGDVGVRDRLSSLATNSDGTTRLGATPPGLLVQMRTSGDQDFEDPVRLQSDIRSTGNDITFHQTVDSDGGASTLEVVSEADGLTWFKGNVGVSARLSDLTTNADGATRLGDASVLFEARTTGDQTYNDAVQLADDARLTGNNITFGGTVDSLDALGRGLEVLSEAGGLTWCKADVGTSFRLESLTTNLDGTTQLGDSASNDQPSIDVLTNLDQFYGDAVALAEDAILTGNDLTFDRTLDGGFDLRLFSEDRAGDAGSKRFNGVVGGATRVRNLVTNASGTTFINTAAIRTSQDQTYGDRARLEKSAKLTGNDITFGRAVDGGVNLALVSESAAGDAGSKQFNGIVGGATPLRNLTTNSNGTTFINTSEINTTQNQEYFDRVLLQRSTTLNGHQLAFGQTVDGPFILRLNSHNSGGVAGGKRFEGLVGGVTPLAALATNANGGTLISNGSVGGRPAVTTTGAQTYGDNVLFGGNLVLQSTNRGTLSIGGTLNAQAAGATATFLTGGVTEFRGRVGNVRPLGSIVLDGVGMTRFAGVGHSKATPTVTTTGTQNWNEPVVIANSPLTSGLIDPAVLRSISGDVIFRQPVSGAGGLDVSARNIEAFNNITVGGSIELQPLNQFVRTSVAGGTTIEPAGMIILRGDLVSANGSILLAGLERSSNPADVATRATIVGALEGGRTMLISAPRGSVRLGADEKLTVRNRNSVGAGAVADLDGDNALVNLQIDGRTATFGDITVEGDLLVLADTVTLLARQPGFLQDRFGVLQSEPDLGVDVVAGGNIYFLNGATVVGQGAPPAFSDIDGAPTGGISNQFLFRKNAVTPAELAATLRGENFALTPDLPQGGAFNVNLANAIAGAVPREIPKVTAEGGVTRALKEDLQRLGITAKELEMLQLTEILRGREAPVYVDLVNELGARQTEVTENRISFALARDLVGAFREEFYTQAEEVDETTGQKKLVTRRHVIRQRLNAAIVEYMEKNPGEVDGLALRQFVDSTPQHKDAAAEMEKLELLFRMLGQFGLNDREQKVAELALFENIVPDAIDSSVLRVAITRGASKAVAGPAQPKPIDPESPTPAPTPVAPTPVGHLGM